MKTRQIVEFLIYPHLFNAFSVLYKGVYCVSFKLYHLSESKTNTYAFPFIVTHPEKTQSNDKNYEEPTVHAQSNFSFQTERFYMVYEQDTKKLASQCVFRLQYQENKSYTTYLSCKLLKKVTKQKLGETNFCTRKVTQTKFELIDTQIFTLNLAERASSVERIVFRCPQFFSAIDLIICAFRYGSKSFRGKDQLSKMLTGVDLSRSSPRVLLQQKLSKRQSRQQQEAFKIKFTKNDLQNYIGLIYLQLQKSIEEYNKWYREIGELRKHISLLQLLQNHFIPLGVPDLSYLNRGRILKASQLSKIYETQSSEQTLVCILEQKELLRLNIRALREHYSTLLFYYSEKQFKLRIKKQVDSLQEFRIKNFVKFQALLTEKDGELLRNTAGLSYSKEITFVPQKIERIPVLLVEGYQQPPPSKHTHHEMTLTVFVHGYQGNSFDFQKSKNYLKRFNRHTHVLIIESITDDMNKSIEELGKSVAQEVKRHLLKTINHYTRINFIGFSLGGLIVRACLQYLNENCQRLGIFVSFSSPHLGISQLENSLVKLGIWFLTKMQKVQNLKELNFQSVQFHDSLLMKLSKCQLISKFKKIVLVSSKDDGFVPLYSTLLQQSLCDKQILLLCQNLRKHIKHLERVQVMFSIDHAGPLDKLTGRRGHIEFLDNDYFLQFFFKLYAPFL